MDLGQFHFLRPYWLAVWPLALFLTLALRRNQGGASFWKDYCDPHLLPFLTTDQSGTSKAPLWLLALAWSLAITALAGPTWSKLPKPVYSRPDALVVVLDLSLSMFSQDTQPSRIQRARFKLLDILRQPRERETGLVVFAGDAFVVSPLTDDAKTIAAMVPSLSPEIMPVQGSRVDLALSHATALLTGIKAGDGKVLLIADGVADIDAALIAAADLRAKNYTLSVLGVGDSQGAPIRLPDGKLLKDKKDNIVAVPIDRFSLRRLARAGGGRYADIALAHTDIDSLLPTEAGGPQDATRQTSLSMDIWEEQGPWLLVLLLPLAAMGFRRGWLGMLAILVFTPPQGHAFEWSSLWLNPDQRGARAFSEGDMPGASRTFDSPAWRGAAQYRAGDYAAAAKSFAGIDTTRGQYNLGNALAKMGNLEQALAAYDRALAIDPNSADAETNRKLIKDLLAQQDEQGEQPKRNDQDEGEPTQEPGEGTQPKNADDSQQPNQAPQDGTDGENSQDAPRETPPSAERNGGRSEPEAADPDKQPSTQKDPKPETPPAENPEPDPDPGFAATQEETASEEDREQAEALAQWLRRIPDDPGGLLRRKFLYQHRLRPNRGGLEQPW